MADISLELEQIRTSDRNDDVRTAIADALETINKASDYSKELADLKDTLTNLSISMKDNKLSNSTQNEIAILKNYVEEITRSLGVGNTRNAKLMSANAPLTRAAGDSNDVTPGGSNFVTKNELHQVRGQINEALSLKATQHDFDYIVGNGFQDWTITDYIIRIREDYNTAIAEMATRSEAQRIADDGVQRLHKVIAVNEEITEDTKLSLTPTNEEIELATMDDLNSTFGRIDSYFTFDWKGDWEIGGINEHGWNSEDATSLRTTDHLFSRDFKASLNSLYSLQIVRYDEHKMMISKSEWIQGSTDIRYYDESGIDTRYVRLLIKKNDESELSDTTLPAQILSVTMNGADWTGKNDNVAVDISVVNKVKSDLSSLDNRTGRLEGRVTAVESNEAAMDGDIETIKNSIALIQGSLSRKIDRAEYGDDYMVYLYSGEELVDSFGPVVSGSGSGGGEGGGGGTGPKNNAELTAKNISGFNTITIPVGASCPITLEWSSIEDGNPTGSGSLTVYVNGVQRILRSIEQGTVIFDASKYFQNGQNVMSITISDIYDNKWYGKVSAFLAQFSIKTSLDTNTVFEGGFDLPFTPSGEGDKTVHFKLDGTELDPFETSLSNRVFTKAIPAQSHGTHSIELWVTADVNGEVIESEHVTKEFISIESGVTTPIISSNFNASSVDQYTNVAIAYKVYDPLNATARVVRSVNGTALSPITVDRTEQTWTYRALEVGALSLTIECRGVTRTFNIEVNATDASIGAVEENLMLYLGTAGRDNGEDNPATWTYENIEAQMTGFGFVSDGWVKDEDNNTVCRHSGDARTYIPLEAFRGDAKSTGMTIEAEFETRYVRNYDSPIISCFSGDRGLLITSQRATLKSEQSEISVQFKEEEHVRIAFTIERRAEDRLLLCYINGICSGAIQYPDDDDFAQIAPVGITIGSSDAVVDVYCLRIYNNNLNADQVLGNMIADTQNVDDMLAMYDRNNIFDEYGNIVISKLPRDLPYMILNSEGTHLPQFKGDKVTISGSYTDPKDNSKSYTFTGAQFDVQGTSSQYYARKNYKAKYKGTLVVNGTEQKKYAMTSNSIPVSTFCFKKDVASSEGANNVILVDLYNKICPYKTPAQETNPLVRQGIEGHPMVIFEDNGETVKFVGKYNHNNDKSTENVFGLGDGDESWEVKNNTSNRVLFKSADFSGDAWLDDFEARYPDIDPPYTDSTQLADFLAFVASTDATAATGDVIEPVTYDGTTYSYDTTDYRLAKFKNEIDNWMEHDSMIFYYLFTDIFLMVDSRAKNMFPSFMGSATA